MSAYKAASTKEKAGFFKNYVNKIYQMDTKSELQESASKSFSQNNL